MSLLFIACWALLACAFMLFGAINDLDLVRGIGAIMALFTCAFVC